MIIHLNGWPGVGKQTIGEALASQIGARFVHNHLLHDVAIVCAGRGSEDYREVYEQVRSAAYGSLVRKPQSETFVMTNALCRNTGVEAEAWGHVVHLAIKRGVPLVPVVLTAAPDENARRVQSVERSNNKLKDPIKLSIYYEIDEIQWPDVPETFHLDTTTLQPQEAKKRIIDHIKAVRPHLLPATKRHLVFR